MFSETQEMIEDSELDELMAVAAYKVMAIPAGKMLPQAGTKLIEQYGLKSGLKAFREHHASQSKTNYLRSICRMHSHQPKLRIFHQNNAERQFNFSSSWKRSAVQISRVECV
jgi:hypothetical protein